MENVKEILLEKREHLVERLEKIEKSKVRKDPLSADSGEQAQELENHEVVDALDDLELNELGQIDSALKRIKEGSFGVCLECGEKIADSRLHAIPFAAHCISCAEG